MTLILTEQTSFQTQPPVKPGTYLVEKPGHTEPPTHSGDQDRDRPQPDQVRLIKGLIANIHIEIDCVKQKSLTRNNNFRPVS